MKRDLKALCHQEFDLLIIGGGVYGATAAWDAASRGLSVAVVDRGDFGGATSANCLKIIHGGLRYLQQLDIKRMRESIRERRYYMTIAPHLIHPLPCVMPTYGYAIKSNEVMRIAMLMNDIISFDRNRTHDPQKRISNGKIMSRSACLKMVPGIDDKRVRGGALWTDAQAYNSDRFILAFITSAVREGANVANYVRVTRLFKEGNRIVGVGAQDILSGESVDIRAKFILNTAGAWIDQVLGSLNGKEKTFQLSTAMNLVIDREMIPSGAAGVTATFENQVANGDIYRGSRVLFMTPWRRYTIVGTFHLPYEGHPDDMHVTEAEIENCLHEFNSAYPGAPISREEVSFFHKGFLPMDRIHVKTGEVVLTKHYRLIDHEKRDAIENLMSVVGVKYTTARDVSEKAINRIVKKIGREVKPCETRQKRLTGGEIDRFDDFLNEAVSRSGSGLNRKIMIHLVKNYGSEYTQLFQYIQMSPEFAKTVPGSDEVIQAEVIQAVRDEMAQKLSDVVLRRTDLGSGGYPGDAAVDACARLMANELDWSKERVQQEKDEVKTVYRPRD